MRFPFALSTKIARHIISNKLRGVKRFALVLQLEPLHTCNLSCTGCGRIREYSTSLKDMMTLEDCLKSAAECAAPMVSICGGEPTIYPQLEELVDGLRKQGRIVYICTNSAFMRKKMREYLARVYTAQIEPKLAELMANGLLTGQDAEVTAAQRIVEGTQAMTVFKNTREQARVAIEAAIKMVKGEKVETNAMVNNKKMDVPSILLKPVVVDKSNIDDVLIKSGYIARDQVYKK